ncbi:uncharacterized protein EDB91DRAFT_812583 [Suillus paluster]|uniref:uncharacterized protein n=1 Tax=Suillus paluster TaxID=48578 RepID=UPI001B8824CE|nr:uncharacterized protein EDB91DRAFT_812583 [Suillus paluster]KAG1729531.1 hypothetical protein EDB91DRAFT_812583 [Suillus paluster]
MSILTIPKSADALFLRPIVIAMNSFVLTSLLSFVMSANGKFDWRPITICVTSDILAIGADHLKDQEEEFSSHRKNPNDRPLTSWFVYARIFLAFSAVFLALALFLCPISTLLATTGFVAPALLWTTPINFKRFRLILNRLIGISGEDEHHPATSASALVIKRIPGMKAIFNGIIRGCGTYIVVLTVLSGSGSLADALPSPWSTVQLLVWSTVNRTCHAVMTDVRDFEDDLKAGVPTIPILIGSVLKTKLVLTACHMLVMLAFIENPYITASCLYATALVWMLGVHSPKKAFLLSTHSQSFSIIWYFLTKHT